MRKIFNLAALATAISVGGCYESDIDLTAGHHAKIEAIDSLLVFRNQAYYFDHGMLCLQSTSPDLVKRCELPYPISIERTAQGNYIIAVKNGQKYNYGLWLRSNKFPRDKFGHCFFWLGESLDMTAANIPLGSHDDLLHVVQEIELPFMLADKPCDRLMAKEELIRISGDRRSEPEFK